MAKSLKPCVRGYGESDIVCKKYVRLTDATEHMKRIYMNLYTNFDIDHSYTEEEYTKILAIAAGALYKLPRTELIHMERLDDYMKHLYKVPGTNKQVIKKCCGQAFL